MGIGIILYCIGIAILHVLLLHFSISSFPSTLSLLYLHQLSSFTTPTSNFSYIRCGVRYFILQIILYTTLILYYL